MLSFTRKLLWEALTKLVGEVAREQREKFATLVTVGKDGTYNLTATFRNAVQQAEAAAAAARQQAQQQRQGAQPPPPQRQRQG